MSMRPRRERGLSMVEVLAAMVIFSAAAAVLFDWIGQVAGRLGKLAQEERMLFARLAAVEYLKTVNPMLEPFGTVALSGDARLQWQSAPVGAVGRVYPDSGLYEVGLFKVELRVVQAGEDQQQSVYLAGWRQVREAESINPFKPAGP
jgi:prepilin-type N-terminal cleavage/methylation domain-containing protein